MKAAALVFGVNELTLLGSIMLLVVDCPGTNSLTSSFKDDGTNVVDPRDNPLYYAKMYLENRSHIFTNLKRILWCDQRPEVQKHLITEGTCGCEVQKIKDSV